VTEVHPAVALLFWLAKDQEGLAQVQQQGVPYKLEPIAPYWERLLAAWSALNLANLVASLGKLGVTDDDSLDAVIALALGLLLKLPIPPGQARPVEIIGNAATGALLLPAGTLSAALRADLVQIG
jgi:hypothetical protein